MMNSSVLIQIVTYLLCMFQGHLPSLSTLNETATSNTGWSAESGWFGVASWCFFFTDFSSNSSSQTCERNYFPSSRFMVAPLLFLISIAYLTHLLLSVLYHANDLSPIPSDDMVLLYNVVCNCRFVNYRQQLFSTSPGNTDVLFLSTSVYVHLIGSQIFDPFHQCSQDCSSYMIDDVLMFFFPPSELAIKEFFEYYRATFPNESITLKMHILEKHVLPEIKLTGFGLGLLSEQGGELLHRRWNVIKFSTRHIKSPTIRVRSTMKKYLTKCMPEVISRVRAPKRRTKKQKQSYQKEQ